MFTIISYALPHLRERGIRGALEYSSDYCNALERLADMHGHDSYRYYRYIDDGNEDGQTHYINYQQLQEELREIEGEFPGSLQSSIETGKGVNQMCAAFFSTILEIAGIVDIIAYWVKPEPKECGRCVEVLRFGFFSSRTIEAVVAFVLLTMASRQLYKELYLNLRILWANYVLRVTWLTLATSLSERNNIEGGSPEWRANIQDGGEVARSLREKFMESDGWREHFKI